MVGSAECCSSRCARSASVSSSQQPGQRIGPGGLADQWSVGWVTGSSRNAPGAGKQVRSRFVPSLRSSVSPRSLGSTASTRCPPADYELSGRGVSRDLAGDVASVPRGGEARALSFSSPLISSRRLVSRGCCPPKRSSRSPSCGTGEGFIQSFTGALSAAIAAMCLSREWISFFLLFFVGSLLLFSFISPATATSGESFRLPLPSGLPWLGRLNGVSFPAASLSRRPFRSLLDSNAGEGKLSLARSCGVHKVSRGVHTSWREPQTAQAHAGFVPSFSYVGTTGGKGPRRSASSPLSATAPSSVFGVTTLQDLKHFSPASGSTVCLFSTSFFQQSSCKPLPLAASSSLPPLCSSSSSYNSLSSLHDTRSGLPTAVQRQSAVAGKIHSSADSPFLPTNSSLASHQSASLSEVPSSLPCPSDSPCRGRRLSVFGFVFLVSSVVTGGVWWVALRAQQALTVGARLVSCLSRKMTGGSRALAGPAADDEEAVKEWSQKAAWSINVAWGKAFLSMVRCFPEVEGLEHLPPPSENVVFVANHCSHLDVAFIAVTVSRHLRFLGKVELLSAPVVGLAMRLSGCPTVDRNSPVSRLALFRETLKLLKTSEERSTDRSGKRRGAATVGFRGAQEKTPAATSASSNEREGVTFVAFPEGKRSLDGRLAPFDKGGIFRLAKQAGVRVVPVSVVGTQRLLPVDAIMPSGKPARGSLRVVVHPPISPVGKEDEDLRRAAWQAVASGLPADQLPLSSEDGLSSPTVAPGPSSSSEE